MTEQAIHPSDARERATRPCKGCGKPVLFMMNHVTGKTVPLDARAPVYFVLDDGAGGVCADPAADFLPALRRGLLVNPGAATALLSGIKLALVSHFAICPKANDFTAKARIDAAAWLRQREVMRSVAARLRQPMTRAAADELASRLESAAGKAGTA